MWNNLYILRFAVIAFLFIASPVYAQIAGVPVSSNAVTCGPATGTLTNAGDTVTLPCPGAPAYIVRITPNGATPLTGTISSIDGVSGGGRLLFKTGVGELDTNVVNLAGTSGFMEYRTVGTGDSQSVVLSCPTACSGSATVRILASYFTSTVFPNAPVHTADEAALRAGRAYNASTGYQSLAAGQNLSFYLSNPASNNLRLIITNRVLSCDTATALSYYGLGSVTANLPATAATISNRKTGGSISITTALYGIATTRPDTNPTTANPIGGILPAAGAEPTLPMRTLEPGTNFAQWIVAPAGLGTTAHCSITIVWYEEPTS